MGTSPPKESVFKLVGEVTLCTFFNSDSFLDRLSILTRKSFLKMPDLFSIATRANSLSYSKVLR